MQLIVKGEIGAIFIQKISGEKLSIDTEITKEYNEDSEEYIDLCRRFESVIGFERDIDKVKFDKELLTYLSSDVSKTIKGMVNHITDVYKKSMIDKTFVGWIEFGGYILNPLDFSAIKFDKFDVNISKK